MQDASMYSSLQSSVIDAGLHSMHASSEPRTAMCSRDHLLGSDRRITRSQAPTIIDFGTVFIIVISPFRMTRIKVAVLDDYNDLSSSYLSQLHDKLEISVFRDTILPSPDPSLLLSRLEPFQVLCTMRERTPLPKVVIDGLPNLKMILTTGMKNRGIDMEACEAKGVRVTGTPSFMDKP